MVVIGILISPFFSWSKACFLSFFSWTFLLSWSKACFLSLFLESYFFLVRKRVFCLFSLRSFLYKFSLLLSVFRQTRIIPLSRTFQYLNFTSAFKNVQLGHKNHQAVTGKKNLHPAPTSSMQIFSFSILFSIFSPRFDGGIFFFLGRSAAVAGRGKILLRLFLRQVLWFGTAKHYIYIRNIQKQES